MFASLSLRNVLDLVLLCAAASIVVLFVLVRRSCFRRTYVVHAQVYRRDFCNNVVEALSLKIRTIHERKIARCGVGGWRYC